MTLDGPGPALTPITYWKDFTFANVLRRCSYMKFRRKLWQGLELRTDLRANRLKIRRNHSQVGLYRRIIMSPATASCTSSGIMAMEVGGVWAMQMVRWSVGHVHACSNLPEQDPDKGDAVCGRVHVDTDLEE